MREDQRDLKRDDASANATNADAGGPKPLEHPTVSNDSTAQIAAAGLSEFDLQAAAFFEAETQAEKAPALNIRDKLKAEFGARDIEGADLEATGIAHLLNELRFIPDAILERTAQIDLKIDTHNFEVRGAGPGMSEPLMITRDGEFLLWYAVIDSERNTALVPLAPGANWSGSGTSRVKIATADFEEIQGREEFVIDAGGTPPVIQIYRGRLTDAGDIEWTPEYRFTRAALKTADGSQPLFSNLVKSLSDPGIFDDRPAGSILRQTIEHELHESAKRSIAVAVKDSLGSAPEDYDYYTRQQIEEQKLRKGRPRIDDFSRDHAQILSQQLNEKLANGYFSLQTFSDRMSPVPLRGVGDVQLLTVPVASLPPDILSFEKPRRFQQKSYEISLRKGDFGSLQVKPLS